MEHILHQFSKCEGENHLHSHSRTRSGQGWR